MALRSALIDPQGFPGSVNADEASPETIANIFADNFGPFSQITEDPNYMDAQRAIIASGPKGTFLITADVIYGDDDLVVDNEVEIFNYQTEAMKFRKTDKTMNGARNFKLGKHSKEIHKSSSDAREREGAKLKEARRLKAIKLVGTLIENFGRARNAEASRNEFL